MEKEYDREVTNVFRNAYRISNMITRPVMWMGGYVAALAAAKLMTFLLRMTKKGLVSAGFMGAFQEFNNKTQGNYTVYNIPLTKDKAGIVSQISKLDLEMEKTRNPAAKRKMRQKIEKLYDEIPEIKALNKQGIQCIMLPKVSGSDQTVQCAVARSDDQLFRAWYLNHLSMTMSGGEKEVNDIKVFTEGNYTIFNLPMEGEELDAVKSDFSTLGINYAFLPDLKVGDNNTQIVVANSDRSRFESWMRMWRQQKIDAGETPGEVYALDRDSYLNTGEITTDEYIGSADQQYQEIQNMFEQESKAPNWAPVMENENSERYLRFKEDKNYDLITVNKETLVDEVSFTEKEKQMQRNGYFLSRIPGTYGKRQEILIVPMDQVFITDEGKTYACFIPKNQNSLVAESSGKITERSCENIMAPYEEVKRGLYKVKEAQSAPGLSAAQSPALTPAAPDGGNALKHAAGTVFPAKPIAAPKK